MGTTELRSGKARKGQGPAVASVRRTPGGHRPVAECVQGRQGTQGPAGGEGAFGFYLE